ncbi:hypothetical protein JVT61DRAFT_10774 [Boletus reticuloceps]|uniref:Uncharacterized protein n=1 Tax=Boletus reticuloceps TaxID=495285 RepID=A0A8I2YFK0_9AGAM|nr:hypothetical protein JVT61DRAFT_10774 [Boletus reticuloceps]
MPSLIELSYHTKFTRSTDASHLKSHVPRYAYPDLNNPNSIDPPIVVSNNRAVNPDRMSNGLFKSYFWVSDTRRIWSFSCYSTRFTSWSLRQCQPARNDISRNSTCRNLTSLVEWPGSSTVSSREQALRSPSSPRPVESRKMLGPLTALTPMTNKTRTATTSKGKGKKRAATTDQGKSITSESGPSKRPKRSRK